MSSSSRPAAAAGTLEPYSAGDVALYHWSPSTRRAGITRYGLMPGKLATDRSWRPPYVAFCDSPSLAWSLSGMTGRGAEHESWDLWMVWASRLPGYEELPMWDDSGRVAEYRVYERIYKRDVWYVATRARAHD